MANKKDSQFQTNNKQYSMPDALKQPVKGTYKVGYEATTGNNTDEGKKTES